MKHDLTLFVKKNISYTFQDKEVTFIVAQELFSSTHIDTGTQRLLRTLTAEKITGYHKVLDVGCGYGPIGLCLKMNTPESIVHMVDRDALAVEFSKANAAQNNLNDVSIYGSLGYDDVTERDFDLIVSNVPAKIGEKALKYWLHEAQWYLTPQGKIVIVVIDAIAPFVISALEGDENIQILFQKHWTGHTVIGYTFTKKTGDAPKESAFDRGVFDREETILSIDDTQYPMQTTYGLPEFDSLSFPTGLLIHKFKEQKETFPNILLFNSGQGHIALAAALLLKPQRIALSDRNVQALRTSARNLTGNKFAQENISLFFQSGIQTPAPGTFDAIAGILPEDEGIEMHHTYFDHASEQLKPAGRFFVAGSSTAITRAETYIHETKRFAVIERKKTRGNSTLILKKIPK